MAIAWHLPNDRVLRLLIGRSDKDRKKQAVTAKGKPINTDLLFFERFGNYTFGRVAARNRSHAPDSCAHGHIGHPVAGDPLWATQDPQGPRTISHARPLVSTHPTTGASNLANSPAIFIEPAGS